MRKRNPSRVALAAWATLACAAAAPLAAQTTFGATNDPTATVTLVRADRDHATLRIAQRPGSAGYRPMSTRTVLRDARTGIAHGPVFREVTVERDTIQVTTLTFAHLDGAAEGVRLSLSDAHGLGGDLYFTDLVLGVPPGDATDLTAGI